LTQFVCKTATATLFLLQVHLSDDRFSIGVTNKKYLEKKPSYNLTCQNHFLWNMNVSSIKSLFCKVFSSSILHLSWYETIKAWLKKFCTKTLLTDLTNKQTNKKIEA